MTLSPCLLVLALSVAQTGGDVVGRPAVQVVALAPPADETSPVEAAAVEVGSPLVLHSVASVTVEAESYDMTSSCRLVIDCRRPTETVRAAPRHPRSPPTELRWQAAPRRRRRRVVPRSCLPLFWLHELPPLFWPLPREERPLGSDDHLGLEAEPTLLCGGIHYGLIQVVDSPLDPARSFDLAAVRAMVLTGSPEDVAPTRSTSSEAR